MLKKITSLVLFFICLAAAVYIGAGFLVYDFFSRVSLNNEENASYTPAHFKVALHGWKDFDTRPYFMPEYQTVSFSSRQWGVKIKAWFIESSRHGPTVIVTHGLGAGKFSATVLVPAGMLVRQGFNVLLIDLRNHGESSCDNGRTGIGNKEYLDVLGAWDWLVGTRRIPPAKIGLYGVSMGGAASLIAFAQEPRVTSAFIDSTFSYARNIMEEELVRNKCPSFLWLPASIAAKTFFNEDLVRLNPADALRSDEKRPIYITHGAADDRINVKHTRLMQEIAVRKGLSISFWYPQTQGHGQAVFVDPDRYASRMADFFTTVLQ